MNDSTTGIWCTGLRSGDMALRLQYGGWTGPLHVEETMETAIAQALDGKENVYVVATYTALVPARNAITQEVKA